MINNSNLFFISNNKKIGLSISQIVHFVFSKNENADYSALTFYLVGNERLFQLFGKDAEEVYNALIKQYTTGI